MSEEQFGSAEDGAIRINKFLALCGIDSRRVADRMIAEGRVEVNGRVIDTPGMKVTAKDFVKVDGRHMTPMEETVVLLNKPRGFVCSREAQGAIGTVYDLLPAKLRHLNYVGRLDADSEGLLIMTNKGELTQKISHPAGGIEKEYWATADQHFENSVLVQFLRGVRIPEGNAKAKYVCRASARRAAVVLEQGLKRQVRQMFQQLGLRVRKLVRVRIGSLWGGDLEPGAWRFLTDEDVAMLLKNPGRPRKYMSAAQLVKDTNKPATAPRPGKAVSDDDYVFNPDDFEGADVYDPDPSIMSRLTDDDDDEIGVGEVMRDDSVRGNRGGRNRNRDFGDNRRDGGFRPGQGGERRREGGFRSGERKEGGLRGKREGGFGGGERRERSFGERREGGFKRRDGGYRGHMEGGSRPGMGGGERREGGFGGRREGGFSGRREGGFGGGERRERSFGERREGGFKRREGGFSGRREGGFGGGERREKSFGERREGGSRGPRREGGFGGFGGGQRREGGRKPGFGGGRPSSGFRGGRGR